MSEFTCSLCQETFPKKNDKEWNDFKAAEEMLTLMPRCKNHPTETICDDCHKIFLTWFNELTDEEKRAIEDEPY
jgi:hypothetical protein